LHGDTERGLFFRGSEPVPFGAAIRPVRDLTGYLLQEPTKRTSLGAVSPP
jgi:nitronate monooxygenase